MKRNAFCRMVGVLCLSSVLGAAYPQAQDSAAANTPELAVPKPAKPQFFAGVVMEINGSHIKVSRDLPGQPPETRDFSIDSKTRAPKGGVKLKSRVTVRYQHLTDHDLALEIQVRPNGRANKSG